MLVVLLSVWVTPRLCASEAPVAVVTNLLSLPQAQQMAFERNWDLLAARSDVDIATAQKLVAREFPNPVASISVAKISVDSAFPNTGGSVWSRDYDSIVAINQLFEIGGKRASRKSSAQAGIEGARARLADARRILELAVAQSYADALQAEASAKVLRESAASLGKEAEIAAIRLHAGDISSSDKSRIELNARQFELDARSAEAAAKTARISLKLLLGAPKNTPDFLMSDTLESLAAGSEVQTRQEIGPGRPDLVAAEKAVKKAEAELRLQKAQRIPDPTFLVQYEHEPLTQPNTIGVGVSFPLPLWNHNRGAIAAAQATRDQAQTQVEKVQAQVLADIATAQVNYDIALQRWVRYRDELREKSSTVRKAIGYAYEKGSASLLDLLSAERDDNTVRLATLQAAHDAAVSAAALKAATESMTVK